MTTEKANQKAEALLTKASEAAAIFSQLSQEHTDRIVKAVFEAAFNHRVELAKMAQAETGMGKWEDKVIKNVVGSLLVYEDIKDVKTAGVISDNKETGIMEVAQPIGPILAVIPVTNPTSTVIFKTLIALKSRNPIIISPHHKAIGCSVEAARICYEAALGEDAPEGCIQWAREKDVDVSSSERSEFHAETQALMSHPKLALILATGGGGVVKAAYASGTPAFGVGSGNVPVLIDKTADISFAVSSILASKTFDNGTVCASEQSIIVEQGIADQVISEFKAQGGYFLSANAVEKVEEIAFDRKRGAMSPAVVGQSVEKIAELAGIAVPAGTKLLLAPLSGVGPAYPLSAEILCPIVAFYTAKDLDSALKICIDLNFFGGMGHSASIYANDESIIREYAIEMNAGRVLVNTPSSQGAIGGVYNKLHTSLTLGCGTTGKNITTDNVTVTHLINIQRVARKRQNERLGHFDKALFYDESLSAEEILTKYNCNY